MPSQADSQTTMSRRVLLKSWNQGAASGTITVDGTAVPVTTTPFRAVSHMSLPISKNGKKIELGSNSKYVPDSSDYIRYRKLRALNKQLPRAAAAAAAAPAEGEADPAPAPAEGEADPAPAEGEADPAPAEGDNA